MAENQDILFASFAKIQPMVGWQPSINTTIKTTTSSSDIKRALEYKDADIYLSIEGVTGFFLN